MHAVVPQNRITSMMSNRNIGKDMSGEFAARLKSIHREVQQEDPQTHLARYEFSRNVEAVARRMGITTLVEGRLFSDSNAYVLRHKGRHVVNMGLGTMRRLDPERRESVISHEIAHVKNGDTDWRNRLNAFALFASRHIDMAVVAAVNVAEHFWKVSGMSNIAALETSAIGLGVVVGTLARSVVNVFVSRGMRQSELRADIEAAKQVGALAVIKMLVDFNPEDGIRTLERLIYRPWLDEYPRFFAYVIEKFMDSDAGKIMPILTRFAHAAGLRTHPTVDSRIRNIVRYANEHGFEAPSKDSLGA